MALSFRSKVFRCQRKVCERFILGRVYLAAAISGLLSEKKNVVKKFKSDQVEDI